MTFTRVVQAIAAIREGRMVILVDDEDRENEGDLCMAAEKVTPEAINFMATHGRGLICLTLTEERIEQLQLPMMVSHNTSPLETAFTVSIEAREGVTTGISAADRATTVLAAVKPDARPEDLVRPGHVFPLRARKGGVLVRTGQTEGSVDLARLAGLAPSGVICEIIKEDGTMARMPDLEAFAEEHRLPIVTIAELIQYRLTHESTVRRLVSKQVRHAVWGDVTVHAYGTALDDRQHLAVVKGDVLSGDPPLVRVHSGYPMSGVLGDLFSYERRVLNAALRRMGQESRGVLVCIDQDVAEVPLAKRIEALGESQHSAPPRAAGGESSIFRRLGVGAQILRDLGLSTIRLLTLRPMRLKGLEAYGISMVAEEILQVEEEATAAPRFELVEGARSEPGRRSSDG